MADRNLPIDLEHTNRGLLNCTLKIYVFVDKSRSFQVCLKNATRGDLVLWKNPDRATFSAKNVISGPLGGALKDYRAIPRRRSQFIQARLPIYLAFYQNKGYVLRELILLYTEECDYISSYVATAHSTIAI